jgi:hypothetical protein
MLVHPFIRDGGGNFVGALITKIVHAQDAYSDCAEAVNTVVNGGQSQ